MENHHSVIACSFWVTELYKSTLYKYIPTTGQLVYKDNGNESQEKMTLKVYLCVFTAIIIAIQANVKPGITLNAKVQVCFTIAMLSALYFIFNESRKKAQEMVLYFNDLSQFFAKYPKHMESRNSWRKPDLLEKLNLALGNIAVISNIVITILYIYGLHWPAPCQPDMAGYFLLCECNLGKYQIQMWYTKVPCLLLKHVIFFINYFVLAWMFSCAIPIFQVFVIFGTISLRNAVEQFQNAGLSKAINDSKNVVLMYRHIQLLSSLGNYVLRNYVTAAMLGCIMVFVTSLAMLIFNSGKSGIGFSTQVIYGLFAGFTSGAILIGIGGMACIHSDSLKVVAHLKMANSDGRRNIRRKRNWRVFYQSCPPIKTEFGWDNFIQKVTALKVIDAGVSTTVSLVLLDK